MNFYQKLKLAQFQSLQGKTLYHGTCNHYLPEIQEHGLVPQVGQFVGDVYGERYKNIPNLIFAACSKNLNSSINAMKYQIAKATGLKPKEVSLRQVRDYGLLIIIKKTKNWKHVPFHGMIKHDGQEIYFSEHQENKKYPQIQASDHYTQQNIPPKDLIFITGNKLVDFIKHNNLLYLFVNKDNKDQQAMRIMRGKIISYYMNQSKKTGIPDKSYFNLEEYKQMLQNMDAQQLSKEYNKIRFMSQIQADIGIDPQQTPYYSNPVR